MRRVIFFRYMFMNAAFRIVCITALSAARGRCYYLPGVLQTILQSLVLSGDSYIHSSHVNVGSYCQKWRKLRHKGLYTDADFNPPNKYFSLLQWQINYLCSNTKSVQFITHIIDTFQVKKKQTGFLVRFLSLNCGKLKFYPSDLTQLGRPSVAPLRSTSRDDREITAIRHS